MNSWQETAVILRVRAHGENGLIVTLMTQNYGRVVGYVPGGQSRTRRMGIEAGAIVDARWQARVLDQMGTFAIEPIRGTASHCMTDPVRLAALSSACMLCDETLPEREPHPGLYHGLLALMDQLASEDTWGPAYVVWEIALMKELGFALDLSRCAAGGDVMDLFYISPKSGVAVSAQYGAVYRAKLLELPEFLKPCPHLERLGDMEDVFTGLKMTGYFLEHWVFNHHRTGVPEARIQLLERVERACDQQSNRAVS